MPPIDWNAYVESLLAQDAPSGYGVRPYTPGPPRPPEPEEPGWGGHALDALGWAKEKVDAASNYYANPYLRNRMLRGETPIPTQTLMKEALIAPGDPTMSQTEQYARSIGRGLTEVGTALGTDPLVAAGFAVRGVPVLGKAVHAGFIGMMGHGIATGSKHAYDKYREDGMTPGVAEELAKVGVEAGLIAAPFMRRRPAPVTETGFELGADVGGPVRPGARGGRPAPPAPGPRPPQPPGPPPPGEIGPGEGAVGRPRDTWFERPERGVVPRAPGPEPPSVTVFPPRPPRALPPGSGEGLPELARTSRANVSNAPESANRAAYESLIEEVNNRLRLAVAEGNAHDGSRLIALRERLREAAWQSEPGNAAKLREPYEAPGVAHEVVQQPQNRPRMLQIKAELEKHLLDTRDEIEAAKVRAAIASLDAQLRQNPLPQPPEPQMPPPAAEGAMPAPPPEALGAPPPPGAPEAAPGLPGPAVRPGPPAGPAPEAAVAPSAATMAGAGAEPGFRAEAAMAETRAPTAALVRQAEARVAGLPEEAAAPPPQPGVVVEGPARDIASRAAVGPEPVPPAPAMPPPVEAAPPAAPAAAVRPAGAPAPAPEGQLVRAGFMEYGREMPTEPLGEMPYVPEAQRPASWSRLKEQVRDAEAQGLDAKQAGAQIAAGYPEEVRLNIERQVDMLHQNRDVGGDYLETLRLDDATRMEAGQKPTRSITDPKTGETVEFWREGKRGKNGDYLWRDGDGNVAAGARVHRGAYEFIVGGDRVMDLPREGSGIIYRATKTQKVRSTASVTPAGSAAQARAAQAGLDVVGGVPEIVSGGADVGVPRVERAPVREAVPEGEPGPRPAEPAPGEAGAGPEPGGRPPRSRAEGRLTREAAERTRALVVLADAPRGRITSADLVEAGMSKKQAVQITRALEDEGVLRWNRTQQDYSLTKEGRRVVERELALAEPEAPPPEVAVEVPSEPIRAVEAGGQELVPGFVEAVQRTPEMTEGRMPGEMFGVEAEAVRRREGPPPKAPEQVEMAAPVEPTKFTPKRLTAKALAAKAPEGKLIAGERAGEAWHGTRDVLVRAAPPRVGAKLLEAGKDAEIAATVDAAAKAARSKAEIVQVEGENALVRLADGTEVLVDAANLAHAAKSAPKGKLTWFGKAEDPAGALVAYRGEMARPGRHPQAVVKAEGAPTDAIPWEESAPKRWVDRETNLAVEGLNDAIRRVEETGNLKTFAQGEASKRRGYEYRDIVDDFIDGREIDPSMEYVFNQSKFKRVKGRLREKVNNEWQDEMASRLEEVPREGPGLEAAADAAEGRIGEFRASERGAASIDLLTWPAQLVRDAVIVGARVAGRGFTTFQTWASQMGRILGGGLKGLRGLWDMVTKNFGPRPPGTEPPVPPRPGRGAERGPSDIPAAEPPAPRTPREAPTRKTQVTTPDIQDAVRASRFQGPLRPGEKPRTTDYPINTETLNTRESIRDFEHRLAEAMKPEFDKNREYRSWAEAEKLALETGLSKADFQRLVKERGSLRDYEFRVGERMRATFGGEAHAKYQAYEAMKQSKTARPAELDLAEEEMIAAIARWGEVTAHTIAAKAEQGRGLSILRKVASELSPQERLYQQAIKYGLSKGSDPKLMSDLGKAVLAKDHAALTKLARKIMKPGYMDMVNEWFVGSILSGPPTPAANITGNWLHQVPLRVPERYIAGVLEGAAARKAGRLPERLPGEAFEAMKAHWKTGFGFAGQWSRIFRETLKENPWDPELGTLKGEFRPPAIPGPLGKVVRTPMRLMQTLDRAARSGEYQAQLASEIYRDGFNSGRARGLTGKALEAHMERHNLALIKDMTRWREIDVKQQINGLKSLTQSENAIYLEPKLNRFGKSAETAARESTFQDAPGAFARAALRLRHTHPWMTLFIPFISTPSRILSQAIARTPFGLARAAKRAIKGETTGGVAADELAKGIWGSVLSAGLYGLAESGVITGSGPTDLRERSMLRETGWEPYSVKIGDTYVSMARLEPLATVLGISADLAETRNAKKAGDLADKLVATMTNNVMSKTYLEGISSLIEAVEDPERYGSTYAKKFVGAFAVPNIVATAARATDPYVRDTSPMEGLPGPIGWAAPTVLSRIPGVSRTLPKRVRGTGTPIKRREHPISTAFSPIRYSREQPGKVVERLMLDVGYIPSRPPKSITVPGTGGRKAVLTRQEKDVYTKHMSRATEMARRLAAQPGFAQADPLLQEQMLKRVYREARDAARRVVLPSVMQRGQLVER